MRIDKINKYENLRQKLVCILAVHLKLFFGHRGGRMGTGKGFELFPVFRNLLKNRFLSIKCKREPCRKSACLRVPQILWLFSKSTRLEAAIGQKADASSHLLTSPQISSHSPHWAASSKIFSSQLSAWLCRTCCSQKQKMKMYEKESWNKKEWKFMQSACKLLKVKPKLLLVFW